MFHGLKITGLSGVRCKKERGMREQGVNPSSSCNWHKDAMNRLYNICDNTARTISGGLWA